MITLRELEPKPGDEVMPFWRKMLAFVKQRDIVFVSPPSRVSETASGTAVICEPSELWGHPFQCSLWARKVTVQPGYVDTTMPSIDGVQLDGRDAQGKQVTPPVLELEEDAAPGDDGRSFVCLQLSWAPLLNVPLGLTIVHAGDLAAARSDFEEEGALEPLAVLYWNAERTEPRNLRQIVHHNLKHLYIPPPEEEGGEEETGQHFFFAT
ncbi:MAG TPA: hypothetical protein PLA50_10455 [Bacteroidia bacterium]|nr:hypothetical protein [Bacteroidia bacterium]